MWRELCRCWSSQASPFCSKCWCSHVCFLFLFCTFVVWELNLPLVLLWAKVSKRQDCFVVFLFLYMSSLTWQQDHMHFALKLKLAFSITLLLPGSFDVFSKGQVCVCVCVRVRCGSLFTHVCWYLFDVCPALQGWKVNSLISPRTQLALWLAERRPGCAVFWRKEDLWNWGGSGDRKEKKSEVE